MPEGYRKAKSGSEGRVPENEVRKAMAGVPEGTGKPGWECREGYRKAMAGVPEGTGKPGWECREGYRKAMVGVP